MDEHVKEWIAERVAQELNPPPKIKFEDLDYPEWKYPERKSTALITESSSWPALERR